MKNLKSFLTVTLISIMLFSCVQDEEDICFNRTPNSYENCFCEKHLNSRKFNYTESDRSKEIGKLITQATDKSGDSGVE